VRRRKAQIFVAEAKILTEENEANKVRAFLSSFHSLPSVQLPAGAGSSLECADMSAL
jgi:hypothetical protein